MTRYSAIPVGLVIAMAFTTASLVSQQIPPNCRDCEPSPYNYSNPSGTYTVGFQDFQFSTQEQNSLFDGAKYWNVVFDGLQSGVHIANEVTSYENAQIKFFVDFNLTGQSTIVAQAHLTPNGSGSIGFNPDHLANWGTGHSTNYLAMTGAHEV